MKGGQVVSCVPGHEAVFKYFNKKQMSREELQEVVRLDGAQFIPFDIEEAIINVEVLDEGNEAEGMRVLLVAVRREMLDQHLRILGEAGLDPNVVDVDSIALANLYDFNQQLGEGSVALIDIGHRATNIHFCSDGISTFNRAIDWGGTRLTEAVERSLRISSQEAENVKEGTSRLGAGGRGSAEDRTLVAGGGGEASTETNVELSTISRPVIAELVREIRRSFDFYEKQLYEKPVERIYLSGGSSKFISLPERLSEELGTEVVAGNPFQFITYDENAADSEELVARAPMLAVATGLAVREVQA
jgi:type IV pilus assembly protein PilM